MRTFGLAVGLLIALAVPAAGTELIETPSLAERVASGELPPVAERVPLEPLVVDLAASGRAAGSPGGTMRMFMTRAKDVRYMSAYGYARLVGYSPQYKLMPDLLRDMTISEDGTSVTLHLRRGHKWSDGHPFTTEDFRYWWEDVALNPDLSPGGPPVEMLTDGTPPTVEVIDAVTIKYTWIMPNPLFVPALSRARPVYIYTPAHYMKQFHQKYADPKKLEAAIAVNHSTHWAKVHNHLDNLYKFDNPELPVLQPWFNTSEKNGRRFVLARNPFYHRIDANGRQLPYIDGVELEIAASGLIPAKVALGEATLQVRSLGFSDAPVLKKGEAAGDYVVNLWRSGTASEVALYPNLTYGDPVWRSLFRETNFRRALSLAVSRKAINKVLYFGLAKERAVAALEESPFFSAENSVAWARFDLDEANRLLDELGLKKRNGAGVRLLPDGRPMEIIIETAGERREVADTLELIAATWAQAGIRLLVRALDRDVMRNRAYSGRSMMVAWYGWNNGVPTADAAPAELAPVDQANYSWPRWGQYHQTKSSAGEAVDMPAPQRLLTLYEQWTRSGSAARKAAIWREMLDIHADQVFVIGTISRAPIPAAVTAKLRNVPSEAMYCWDPGGHLGILRMDEFFFADGEGS
jgi:peptide/nickel transport system substrate-binding protein